MSQSKPQILFLAPQPFYQERGTPIAVRMAVEALSPPYDIDLLTYNEGFDVPIENVNHLRMWAPKWLKGVRPGISIKKLIADFFFLLATFKLLFSGLVLSKKYQAVHAVEEAVFCALPFCFFTRTPLVYDMDSSIAQQLLERWKWLLLFSPVLFWFESIALKSSSGVLAVCDELVSLAKKQGAKNVSALYDISLIDQQSEATQEDLKVTINSDINSPLVMYIGNLESYQGIDLLLESIQPTNEKLFKLNLPPAHFVIIGGSTGHIEHYANKALRLNVQNYCHLIGTRPLSQLGSYLKQAAVLLSPRIKGNNTPMKVYSYLDSGVPLVATSLITHTQAMTENEAFLANPSPTDYSNAIVQSLTQPDIARQKAEQAKELVKSRYTKQAFSQAILKFYSGIIS